MDVQRIGRVYPLGAILQIYVAPRERDEYSIKSRMKMYINMWHRKEWIGM